MTQRSRAEESAVRGKQIVWTAAIALAVVVGYQAYAAKKA